MKIDAQSIDDVSQPGTLIKFPVGNRRIFFSRIYMKMYSILEGLNEALDSPPWSGWQRLEIARVTRCRQSTRWVQPAGAAGRDLYEHKVELCLLDRTRRVAPASKLGQSQVQHFCECWVS